MNNPANPSNLPFFITPPHKCSYLPDREAVTLFADPYAPKSAALYSVLSNLGFRRSGEHLYRPKCPGCRSCIPVRIPVDEFRKNRGQRRNWKQNNDLQVTTRPANFIGEHYELFKDYIQQRHPDGGMNNLSEESYMDFVSSSWSDTLLYEFRSRQKLVAVAVVDRMQSALSAVYTFFDPEYESRSPGRFAILYEIEQARLQGLQWLYLGYWIDECRKMQYKSEYQPLEYFQTDRWIHKPENPDPGRS